MECSFLSQVLLLLAVKFLLQYTSGKKWIYLVSSWSCSA